MKIRVSFAVVFAVLIIFSGTIIAAGSAGTQAEYQSYIKKAEKSVEKKLYMQALEEYKQAYSIKKEPKLCKEICNVYEKCLQDEIISETKAKIEYISFLSEAVSAFPQEEKYWMRLLTLEMETEAHKDALKHARKAEGEGINSKAFQELYRRIYYVTDTDFTAYGEFYNAGNGYFSAQNGTGWKLLDASGEELTSGIDYMGPPGDEGYTLMSVGSETVIYDVNHVARGRFGYAVEEAGCYCAESDRIAVKIDGVWSYVNLDGKDSFGAYEEAGKFVNHRAAVKEEGQWYIIDEKGQKIGTDVYEDIKLGLDGSYLVNQVMVAKKEGQYQIYNEKGKAVSKFTCEDMDRPVSDTYIAYRKDGKWGFVDYKGKVVLKPEYEEAKSFSHGFAAVRTEDGKWGFLNSKFQLVVDAQYSDADYFNSARYCMVEIQSNYHELIYFINF